MQWLLICLGLLTILITTSMICGQWPIFQGTFIQRLNFFITFGAYDYFRRFVSYVIGDRGSNALLSVEYYCCDQPNPILQLIYLFIIGGTYYLIVSTSFIYIPGYYISGVHRYTTSLAVGVGILLFLLTSFTDPGVVNTANVSQYLSAYPYDNIIFSKKECSTCKIPKPARSKHCSICNRCVARFDHHCEWTNTCIGEKNTRYFMAFIIWHFLICIYGIFALSLILAGRMKELQVVHILTAYYGVENSFRKLAPFVVQWLLDSHNTQILIMVFLVVVSLFLADFCMYHAKLCLTNTTTNESFKWRDYLRWQMKVSEAKASAEALKASLDELSQEKKSQESKWKRFFKKSRLEDLEVVKNNIYDKGFLRNIYEAIVTEMLIAPCLFNQGCTHIEAIRENKITQPSVTCSLSSLSLQDAFVSDTIWKRRFYPFWFLQHNNQSSTIGSRDVTRAELVRIELPLQINIIVTHVGPHHIVQALNKFTCIALAGVATEYLLYGTAEGGLSDINTLDKLLKSLGFTQKKADAQVRWAVLNTILLLRCHENARAMLAEAMSEGRSVGSCVDIIEKAIDVTQL